MLFQTEAGVWTHVALVYDGMYMKIYVNGNYCNQVPLDGTANVGDVTFLTLRGR